VKRRKYNEDLDFKVVDDDGETIAVLGTGRIPALNAATLTWQAEVTISFFIFGLVRIFILIARMFYLEASRYYVLASGLI
jgi:hypothetical protein